MFHIVRDFPKMSDVSLNEIRDWVAGKGCDRELHDRIWRSEQTGCPRCRKFNPNWKPPKATPETQRTASNVIDLTTPPTVSTDQSPSNTPSTTSISIRQRTKPTYGHGTGAYNALAGPADQKRVSGPANTTKAFLKSTHAGAPAFTFRPEAGKKVPAKSEEVIDVTWIMHLVTWKSQSYPHTEEVVYLGKPHYNTVNFDELD